MTDRPRVPPRAEWAAPRAHTTSHRCGESRTPMRLREIIDRDRTILPQRTNVDDRHGRTSRQVSRTWTRLVPVQTARQAPAWRTQRFRWLRATSDSSTRTALKRSAFALRHVRSAQLCQWTRSTIRRCPPTASAPDRWRRGSTRPQPSTSARRVTRGPEVDGPGREVQNRSRGADRWSPSWRHRGRARWIDRWCGVGFQWCCWPLLRSGGGGRCGWPGGWAPRPWATWGCPRGQR